MRPDSIRVPVGPGSAHFERYGHGSRSIVLIHGFATCAFLWREVGPILASAGFTVYAMDLFGYGESDRAAGADLSIAAQAEYLDQAMTSLRLSRVTIAGNDIGGLVGLRLAATRPERVSQLVLINPPDLDDLPPPDILSMQRNTARFAFRLTRGILGAAPLVETILTGSVSNSTQMPPNLIARYLAPYAGEDGVKHLLTLGAAVKDEDFDEIDLNEVETPTLVIRGADDQWTDGKAALSIQNSLNNSSYELFDGVGRLIAEEDPGKLASAIISFIGFASAKAEQN